MISPEKNKELPKIGNEFNSETSTPQSFIDKINNITYVDTPGFESTKGPI